MWTCIQLPKVSVSQAIVAMASLALVPRPAAALPPSDAAFGAARTLPGDVSLAVRIRGSDALRADATLERVRGALGRMVGSRELGAAWERFAADLGMEGAVLAERLMGQDAVYAERTRAGGIEWVAIVRSEQPMQDLMVSRLKPAVGVGGRCVYPERRIATTWRPPYLLIGPSDRTGLLDETVARFDASGDAGSLAVDPDLAPVSRWDPWPVEVVLRHELPTGGLTALTARPDDGVLRIRHRSRFERPPIHVGPGIAADRATLRALSGTGLAAFTFGPWRGVLDPAEPLDAVLLEGGFDESMRANLGARQVALLDDAPMRGTRVRVPSVAVAFEVRDPILAQRQWASWARRLSDSIARRAGLQPASSPPPWGAGEGAGVVRSIDVSAALRALTEDHPFARGVRLAWSGRTGPGGSWMVVGSEPMLVDRLAATVAATGRAPDEGGANELAEVSGEAVGAHLRSWLLEPGILVRGPVDDFAAAVELAAEIAAAAPMVRWRASGFPGGVIEGAAEVELRPRAAATGAR